ncbi:MAG TPA: DUF378 domain-containing protein [Gammaproteobacteria bacterium]|jgi:hypothetical protein|nr:DUF378 domain-containing protein [Gammaproteobacteria bacterium]
MMNAGTLSFVAWILVIIGGINWLLVGLFGIDIVASIFGATILARLIYIIIGLAACYLIYLKVQKRPAE